MSNPYGLSKYKQTSVTTASRGQVLLMLYEAAIKHCRIAIEALNANPRQIAKKGESILKVQDIVNELSLSLDHNVGGDISRDLERLYNYMIEQLVEANIKNETKPLENIVKLLETLYEGWKGAVSTVAKQGGDPALLAAAEKTGTATPAPQAPAQNTKPAQSPPVMTGGIGMFGAIPGAQKKGGK